ncbi:hypothetical protein D3C87_1175740 [compost metagenome]
MVYKFHKKVNRVNLVHFTLQISWLAAFILTLPQSITRSDLILRLLLGFGGFTLLSFGLRHFYVRQAVRDVQSRIHTTETSMHRLLGLFDDFYGLAETHLESVRRVQAPPPIRELLITQADEMVLRLVKTSTDVEKMKRHLRFVYIAKPTDNSASQMKRYFESTYYYR